MRGLSPRLGATSREFRQMCSVATGSTTSVGMVRIIVVSLSVARCSTRRARATGWAAPPVARFGLFEPVLTFPLPPGATARLRPQSLCEEDAVRDLHDSEVSRSPVERVMTGAPCCSSVVGAERSCERITGADLARLGEFALLDLAGLVDRETATGRRYRHRLLCIALCQGAAQHYVDGENGVKDFDVWSFFAADPAGPFPYRRRVERDFGRSKFARHPADPPRFVGRRVDLGGRSLSVLPAADPVESVRSYLAGGRTETARRLSEKPVVLLWPAGLRGRVIWRPVTDKASGVGGGVLQGPDACPQTQA